LVLKLLLNCFGFRSCYSSKGLCDYPSAHIKLSKNQQMLMIGQKYKMIVHIELPESPVNEEIGKLRIFLFIKC
jgi:seipin